MRPREARVRGPHLSLGFGVLRTLCLRHLGAAVAGVVHLQAVVQLVQVFFHFSDAPGHMFQPKAHLWGKTKPLSWGLPLLQHGNRQLVPTATLRSALRGLP